MLPMGNFGAWLEAQLDTRGWKQAELARRAHVAEATLSRIVGGTRQVGPDVALSIARALGEQPEAVFQEAGFLPSLPPAVAEEHELVAIIRDQQRIRQSRQAGRERALPLAAG